MSRKMEVPEMGGALVSPERHQQKEETPKVTKNLELSPPPSPSQRHYHCPRCQSANTKFCYYNNYKRSQPRHYCRDCRRYWTVGGILRNVPIGGSTRRGKQPLTTWSPYIGNIEENKQHRLALRTTMTAPTYAVWKKEASLVSTPSFGPILQNFTTYGPNSGSLPQLPEVQLLNCHDAPFPISQGFSARNAFYTCSTIGNSSSSSNSNSSYYADPIPPFFANPSVKPNFNFP